MYICPKTIFWAIATLSALAIPTHFITYPPFLASAQITQSKAKEDQVLQQCKQNLDKKQYEAALRSCHQALAAFQQIKNPYGEAKALMNLGLAYRSLSQYGKSISYFQRALSFFQQSSDQDSKAQVLMNLGLNYGALSQFDQAINYYQQAIPIFQQFKDSQSKANLLFYIGVSYAAISNYAKAIDYNQKSLDIYEQIKDQKGKANALLGLGLAYQSLSQYEKAINYYQESLAIREQLKDYPGAAMLLSILGEAYPRLSQPEQAIVYSQKALGIYRQLKNLNGEAGALNAMGTAYQSLSQYEKAITYYQQALPIFRQVKDFNGEAETLVNFGKAYQSLSQYEKAITYYQQALPIFVYVKDREGEATTLSHIGNILKQQQNIELAIVFYKKSVNMRETIRADIRKLPRKSQESYTQSVADTYRALANLLLQKGRILEAQQVLELLKVQEVREFTRDARFGEQTTGLGLTLAEQKILDQHGTLIAFSQKVYDCKKDKQHPCAELGQLNQQLYLLNQQYTQAMQSFEREIRDRKDPEMVDPGKLVAQAKPIVEAEPGTLLIYPLVLEDKTWLLWVARGGVVKSVEIPISRQQLGEAVVNFRNLVQDRRSTTKQVQAAGKHLYKILFQSGTVPLATEMQQNQIRYLVFALDRVTRYIPMAALYDGQHYLTEKYTVSTVISAGLTNVDRLPSNPKNNPVLALGVSESVENLAPLENVHQELHAIVQQSPTDTGIYPGHTFLNRDFNQQALLTHLLGHTFLHIATHAAFLPNNPADSFILMGTGKLTIPQIRSLPDLASVRMVVLSACETALGGPDQDGIEISGISSYFLNSGVETVIASLWAVNDASTSLLMQQFYQNLATGTMTKAEALRQAQLSLLKGKVTGSHAAIRADVDVREETSARAIARQHSDFSHPYYWAPFILIGNRL